VKDIFKNRVNVKAVYEKICVEIGPKTERWPTQSQCKDPTLRSIFNET